MYCHFGRLAEVDSRSDATQLAAIDLSGGTSLEWRLRIHFRLLLRRRKAMKAIFAVLSLVFAVGSTFAETCTVDPAACATTYIRDKRGCGYYGYLCAPIPDATCASYNCIDSNNCVETKHCCRLDIYCSWGVPAYDQQLQKWVCPHPASCCDVSAKICSGHPAGCHDSNGCNG